MAQEEAKLRAQKKKLVPQIRKPMRMYKIELLKDANKLEEKTPQPIITI